MNSIKHAKAVISYLVLILIHSLMGIHAQTQAPYGGIPRTIPGQISSIDFDEGGEGIAYHDETPNDKDFYRNESVDIEHGEAYAVMFNMREWLEYTVNVAAGTYDMSIRLGAKTIGGQIRAFLEDSLIATFNIPSSAGSRFGALQTHAVKDIVLSGGSSKVLRLESVNGDFLFEWIKFQPAGMVKPQTPFGEIPWTVPGRIWAFDFDNGGEGIAYHDLTLFNEGNWRLRMDENVDIEMKDDGYFITSFKNGEWLEYTVNVETGAYDIGISVASPSVGKQLKAYLNDTLIAIFDIPKTGSYKNYKTFWVNNIVLPGGTGKILRLENVNGDFNFEWIKFEPVKTLPVRTIPGIVQAEDFDLGGEGVGYHDVTPFNDLGLYRPSEGVDISYCYCTSDTAPDYWIGWFKHGEWLKYTVNVDSGIYDISIRVASVTTGKQLKAFLDETLIATFDIPNTGNYGKYQTFTLHNIVLPKGAGKKLRLENVNNDFDFDWIRFEPSAQNQTPYEGTPQTIPGVIEAENYDEGGEGVAYHDVTPKNEGWWRTEEGVDVKAYYCGDDYFVGAVGWFKKGEWMEYTVNVETGIYNISIRTGTAKTGRKLNVYLDNNLITTFSVPKTGIQSKEEGFDYYIFQNYTLNNISITGGEAKILRLENVNGDFDIDWIEFERVGTIKTQYPNNGVPGTIPGTIEAEDFDNGGEGVAYHDVTPINEGGCEYRANESVDVRLKASVDGFGRIGWIGKFRHGEWMEYTVNVDSGTYDISIMVGAEKAGKQLKAYLNDTLMATFNIPQTGGFTVWQTVCLKNIHISGGANKILKLENVHGDFNLSWIKFERSGEIKTQTPYGETPRSVPGIIEAEEFDEGGEGVAYHDVTPDGGWWLRTDEGVDIIRKNDYDYFFSVGRFKNGEWMEYTVDVDSGAYNISINVASVSPGKQLKAYLNDSLFASFEIPNTGSYKKYKTSVVYNINLPGGSGKILKLENVNNDFDIDWIQFEPVISLPSHKIPGTIQAEDFDLGGEGIAYHDVTPGNDIGWYRTSEGVDIGYNYSGSDTSPNIWIGWFKHGEWMNYTVNVEAGMYDISIRVASVTTGKQLKAYLNEALIATFNVPKTGSYSTYQTYTVNNVALSGGTGKILRLENVNDDFDFDWIQFTKTGNSPQNNEQKNEGIEMDEKPELKGGSGRNSDKIPENRVTSLLQNVPNPFNRSTKIDYYLPETVQNAVLKIYRVEGLYIKSIQLVNKGAGSITIDGSELLPGIYIYSLSADGQEIDSKRMILLK